MNKVIVTGATGFIGEWLVKELIQHDVYVYAIVRHSNSFLNSFESKNVRIIICPLSDIKTLPDLIEERGFDAFINLAWDGSGGYARADYHVQLSNVMASLDCVETAKNLKCRKLLCAGTISEKIAETVLDSKAVSQNMIYAESKHNLHYLLDIVCRNNGLEYIWMQFSNIFGPGNNSGNIINYMLTELKSGRIPTFSEGTQPYDFLYVEDLVSAIRMLAEMDTRSKCYFIGSGEPRQLREYLLETARIFGDAQIGLGLRPDDGQCFKEEWFSIDKLKADTGFSCKWSFADAMRKTIQSL
ncbi:MAG: NAD(P)-dependent oxidoreductase [Clostridia bacterium]|nr:NAD(P)-dependent oxidoreductase [Clostridia bacterium]